MDEPEFCPLCDHEVYPYHGHRNIFYFPCYGCGSVVSFGNPEDPERILPPEEARKRYRRRPYDDERKN